MTGIELIEKERYEQVVKHGRTIEKDIFYNSKNQLSTAASILCMESIGCIEPQEFAEESLEGWNTALFEKMFDKPYEKRLIIAGALIAAELDRLQNM